MRVGELLFMLFGLFIVVAFAGALTLAIWWLWRKITLPAGAPPPVWVDLNALKNNRSKISVAVRLVMLAVLGLLMTAPLGLINDLIRERTASYRSVVQELSQTWGGKQLLIGPMVSVPYTIKYNVSTEIPLSDQEKRRLLELGEEVKETKTIIQEVIENKTAIMLPEQLEIKGDLEPSVRRRSVYEINLYTANLALSGSFKKPDFTELDKRVSEVHWDRCVLVVNLTDTKAFSNVSPLLIAGDEYKFVPGTQGSAAAPTGFSALLNLEDASTDNIPFEFNMSVKGSHGFYMAPIGVTNQINLKSSWPHPKFSGSGLPTDRNVDASGFDADWKVPNLVRNYPQFAEAHVFESKNQSLDSEGDYGDSRPSRLPLAEYVVGLDFFEPVFHYSVLTRAVKYALMFIGLTFLSVLLFEATLKRSNAARLHLVQYGLIGLGLCMFYLVLLTAAEQMSFGWAYLLAAAVNILLIGGYVRASLKRGRAAFIITGILSCLYGALFFILRMEDYALVAGTTLLLLAVGAMMYFTRNLSNANSESEDKEEADAV